MSVDRFADWLRDMHEAASQACHYIEGMERDEFLRDAKTQDAVAMKLLVIGELAAKLFAYDPERCALHKLIPWKAMKGMRNRIAHGYFEIDPEVVWATVRRELPDLTEQLEVVLSLPGKG